jgi:hypothetical protein
VTIDDHTDVGDLARRALGGTLGVSLHPEPDSDPGFWLQRLYRLLGDLPLAERVSRSAASLILDADPRVRLGAIRFFALGPDAPGGETLATALREHPELFVDIIPPNWPVTLERSLLNPLSSRIRLGDSAALELVRAALFRPFQPLDLREYLYELADVDQEWLLDHGDQIVAAVPDLWEHLRYALESEGAPRRRLADLVKRVHARRH